MIKKKALAVCELCSEVTKISLNYQPCVSANTEHSHIAATVKKINSVAAKSTMFPTPNSIRFSYFSEEHCSWGEIVERYGPHAIDAKAGPEYGEYK